MARICMIAFRRYASDPRVGREAEALLDRGDTVDVISMRGKSRSRRTSLRGVRVYGIWRSRYQGGNAAIYLAQYVGFLMAAGFTVSWLHLRRRYDVIHVHTMPDFLVYSAVVPKLLGARIVLDVHELTPELYASKFGLGQSHWIVRLVTWVERRSVGFADRAIAVHEPHLEALVRHGNPRGKFTVLLNSADPKLFPVSSAEVRVDRPVFRLLYHGTIARRHGLETALRAVALARKEIANLEFRIVGRGDDLPRVQKLVEDLGLEDIVALDGASVPLGDLAPIIMDADVGIVPILSDSFTEYMLPTKLLECVSLGLPVICSETATIRTYFDDDMVRFVTPGDPDELAESIVDLYHHPEKRRELAQNAAVFNERFGWESQKISYYELIDSLAGAARRGSK